MGKEAVFTMKLEPELRDALMVDAVEVDRPASQIVRELIRDYLRKREEEKLGYDEFLRRKVEKSRASIAAGRGYTNEEVQMRMKKHFEEWERRKREDDA
ncbi:antitoxin of toxin-antitoxin stability system [Mesorhizobium sp. BAC0120]|uniref:CopG family ribbon-helix-helix protein n=1 Tax=Mesorhizobium sp. BAC0120 TaxID=3090670 RepID=UPI00298CBA0B|nr:antitoxin of toxin-antitoxin stability system [Mesorhizobium sp. BAC0120]MDW6026491.1 antitoxin of toxin-antitoxin stability system [Mesorhizobium sp. BAC0120]